MEQPALEMLPARRVRGLAVIGTAVVLLAGASLAYLWPQLTYRAPVPQPQAVQVLAASFVGADVGWVVAKDSSQPNGPTGIFRTFDGGRHWTSLPVPLAKSYAPLLQFFDASRGVLLMLRDEAAGRPRLFSTDSGGSGWRPLALPVEAHAAAGVASFGDPRSGWFLLPRTGGLSELWRTRDGAQSWQELDPPALDGGHVAVDFLDPEHGLVAGGRLWSTADGGDSWRLVDGDVPIGSVLGAAAVAGAEVRVPISWPGGAAVLASHDGGAGWASVTLPGSGPATAVAVATVADWYVATPDSLSATHDGGATWTTSKPRLPRGTALGALTMGSGGGWSVGSRGPEASQVLRSRDGGRSWAEVGLPRVS